MHIISAQLLSLTCIFFSMIGVFLLPYWWVRRKPLSFEGDRYQVWISFANCFSGGVFIATFFVGLMPEVRSLFCEVFKAYQITSTFPVTEFVIFIGFFLALGIEQCVLEYKERNSLEYTSVPTGSNEDTKKSDFSSSPVSDPFKDITESNPLDYGSDVASKTNVVKNRCDSESLEKLHSHGHGHSHDISQVVQGESGIRLGMLMVSLGVHSVFEGLALGLQNSVTILINLVVGVAVHELLVAFAMGVNVSRLRFTSSMAVKLAIIFSASIPVGQVLGLLIGRSSSTAGAAASAVLQGVAAGTFVHVTFLEVIPAEFAVPGPRFLKVLFLGLGFTLLLICMRLIQWNKN